MERFFRNLLLGDGGGLRNRYLHIHPAEEWRVQPNQFTPASTEQVSEQVPEQVRPLNTNIATIVNIIGDKAFSVSEIMKLLGLKHRPYFLGVSS